MSIVIVFIEIVYFLRYRCVDRCGRFKWIGWLQFGFDFGRWFVEATFVGAAADHTRLLRYTCTRLDWGNAYVWYFTSQTFRRNDHHLFRLLTLGIDFRLTICKYLKIELETEKLFSQKKKSKKGKKKNKSMRVSKVHSQRVKWNRTHHGIYKIVLCWDTFCGIIWVGITNESSQNIVFWLFFFRKSLLKLNACDLYALNHSNFVISHLFRCSRYVSGDNFLLFFVFFLFGNESMSTRNDN